MSGNNITVKIIDKPFSIGKMGTSGLRLTQETYNQPDFLEQFIEGVALYFAEITAGQDDVYLVIGGDPRKGNWERIQKSIQILTAHGFKIYLAKNGLASTPAMSHAIRHLKAAGGIVLTASHNPFTDVGIKINMKDGSPALDDTINRVHELQNSVVQYSFSPETVLDDPVVVTEIDIIAMYADLLDNIFDFASMRKIIEKKNVSGIFDSMHGAAGPFAVEIFVRRLAMDVVLLRSDPREDFGGNDSHGHPLHPEPDFDYVHDLIEQSADGDYTIMAAWDSDVDRRLDGGNGFFLESADEFAVFSKYSDLIKIADLFTDKIYFCRSTVTADTIDRMADYLSEKYLGAAVVETPTGFKWIAELGNWGVEESNGVGNPYLREKDGIFATVFLLKIMLETGKTARELMEDIWQEFGRVYFTRGEVSGSDLQEKDRLTEIFNGASQHEGKVFGGLTLEKTENWDYRHPHHDTIAAKSAAWVLNFSEGNTIKARFSGTGSGGYTLRIYCSKYDSRFDVPKSHITVPMKEAFDAFLAAHDFDRGAEMFTDANQPDPYGV